MNRGDRVALILDTDIGSDIDDAFALAYLLAQPRCELLGVTTVTGDVAQRCACVEIICRAAGRTDIPIHAGASDVLLVGPGQPDVPQYAAIRHLPHRIDWPPNTAVDFLRKTIRARPGEVTLLTVGPFTNAALLLAVDPPIASLLKGFVSMAGLFYPATRRRFGRALDWNSVVDPIAAAMVYHARVPGHTSLGLDVSMQCEMSAEAVRQRLRGPMLEIVALMSHVWFEKRESITFHDPLAAAAIFRPELCEYEQGVIEVPLSSRADRQGRTRFTRAPAEPHRAARRVNVEAFFAEFWETLSTPPPKRVTA
jgi:purine nucleosidase